MSLHEESREAENVSMKTERIRTWILVKRFGPMMGASLPDGCRRQVEPVRQETVWEYRNPAGAT